jgi:glycerophosphoryl diester phosphodiesterase
MILISHRGNINGCNSQKENTQEYIQKAIDAGYHVEIDVWLKNNQLFLGHDQPETPIYLNWLIERKDKLWIHCKNFESLSALLKMDLNVFYHENEDYTIISNGMIWAHNLKEVNEDCIIPLLDSSSAVLNKRYYNITPVYGICSDHVQVISNMNVPD